MAKDRTFKTKDGSGKDIELRIKALNQVTLSKGDMVFREYFSKAIRAGVMTNAEANKILRERGIWSEPQEEELLNLQIELNTKEDELKDKKSKDDGLALYSAIKVLRDKIDALRSIRKSVSNNTAETMAAEMRTQFFASECSVYNDSGRKVFSNLDDFLSRLDEQLALDCYKEALLLNYERAMGITLPDNLDSKLPEDEWLESFTAEEVVEQTKEPEVKTEVKRTRKKKTAS